MDTSSGASAPATPLSAGGVLSRTAPADDDALLKGELMVEVGKKKFKRAMGWLYEDSLVLDKGEAVDLGGAVFKRLDDDYANEYFCFKIESPRGKRIFGVASSTMFENWCRSLTALLDRSRVSPTSTPLAALEDCDGVGRKVEGVQREQKRQVEEISLIFDRISETISLQKVCCVSCRP
jgi:hypothetical protein